ncbi:MAG: SOS response-associated peptidase [Actinomycetota bacterium]|nr:SOS response-associated peptidase [Actinomycetota bacterium]
MCGRYTATTAIAELARFFAADRVVADELGPRYNVAPTDDVYAVAVGGGQTRLGMARWGLVPGWADSPAMGSRLINARAETLLDKAAFRPAFTRRRCLVPADGFYEWQVVAAGGPKQPWYIPSRDGSPLAFAGLWESWRPAGEAAADGGRAERIVSCTIVTTAANDTLAPIHSRMPAILAPEVWASWLDPANDDVEVLQRLLVPAPERSLAPRMVSPLVNAVANDGPALIELRDQGERSALL